MARAPFHEGSSTTSRTFVTLRALDEVRARAILAPPMTTGRRTLGHANAWSMLRGLVARISTALAEGAAIDACLDDLVEGLGADRGLVLLPLSLGSEVVVNARADRRPLTAEEREEI